MSTKDTGNTSIIAAGSLIAASVIIQIGLLVGAVMSPSEILADGISQEKNFSEAIVGNKNGKWEVKDELYLVWSRNDVLIKFYRSRSGYWILVSINIRDTIYDDFDRNHIITKDAQKFLEKKWSDGIDQKEKDKKSHRQEVLKKAIKALSAS